MSWIVHATFTVISTAAISAAILRVVWSRRALTESAARLHALYEENRAVMMVSDATTGQVMDANPAALEFYGWTLDEMRERRVWDINVGGEPVVSAGARAPRHDQGCFITAQRAADGSMRDVEILTSHAMVRGRLVLYSIVHDIASRRLAERQLEMYRRNLESLVQSRTAELVDANRRLRDANDAKGRFLSNMNHELRTPLNSVIGFSGMLAQGLAGELNSEQRRQIEMINHSGRRLLELVEGVLGVAAINAEEATVTLDEIDIVALAREALESVRPLAVRKGLRLRDGLGDSVCHAATDTFKVRQVLVNLLSNAVKFTEKGDVSIGLECLADEARLSVTDTGCGISAEQQDVIFDEFKQLDIPGIAKPSGAGLGLTVAKALTRLLGGRIELTSRVGRGSTFTLALPMILDGVGCTADRAGGIDPVAAARYTLPRTGT
jgi:PAS domain S-box-containing protein